MKVTLEQIIKVLDSSFCIGEDGNAEMYNAISCRTYEATLNANLKKSKEYYAKTDLRIIAREIKKIMSDESRNPSSHASKTPQLFDIAKSYEGNESRNQPQDEQDLTWEEAVNSISGTEASWRRHGGMIISASATAVTVEDVDGQIIEYKIVE